MSTIHRSTFDNFSHSAVVESYLLFTKYRYAFPLLYLTPLFEITRNVRFVKSHSPTLSFEDLQCCFRCCESATPNIDNKDEDFVKVAVRQSDMCPYLVTLCHQQPIPFIVVLHIIPGCLIP